MIVEFTYDCGTTQLKRLIKHGEYRYIIRPLKIQESLLMSEMKNKKTSNNRKDKIKKIFLPPVQAELAPYNDIWFTDRSPLHEGFITGLLPCPFREGKYYKVETRIVEE